MSRSIKHLKDFEYKRHVSKIEGNKLRDLKAKLLDKYGHVEFQRTKTLYIDNKLWFSLWWYTREEKIL